MDKGSGRVSVKIEISNLEELRNLLERFSALTEEANALINEISNLTLEPKATIITKK